MEVFLSIVRFGAGGRELRLCRLKPLAWVLGKKCWHDAYGYVCFGDGGAGGAMAAAAAAGAKRGCVCVCKSCYDKMADYTVRITGWVLKKKSQFYRALNYYLWSLQSLKHPLSLAN
jgi:hypothetical protein